MIKRKVTIGVTIIFLVCVLVSCSKDTQEYYGNEVDENTLRICIDVENRGVDFNEYELTRCYEELLEQIKVGIGIQNIVLEVLPGSGADRETALHRIRTEIMAGEGPDVFILSAVGGNFMGEYESALVNFPEKSMESGLFLPLDTYMEEHTQFTDWDAQTKAILNAGRTDEGQNVIPMKYTFPVTVYPKHAATIPYTKELTLHEIVNDAKTNEIGAVLYTGQYNDYEQENQYVDTTLLTYLIGKLADYKEEELLFTEAELHELLSTMHNLQEDAERNPCRYIREEAGYWLLQRMDLEYFDTEMTLVPHYSRNGGIAASIVAYTAVNRNTRFPEEAFSVVDFLMQEEMQMESKLYSHMLGNMSIPLQNDIGYDGKPLYTDKYFSPSMYDEFLSIKEQITEVNFRSELDMMLADLACDSLVNEVDKDHISEIYEKMDRMVGE